MPGSPEGDSNVCFVEAALGGKAHWIFSNIPTLRENVEDSWEWLSAIRWQHWESKRHDVDPPASTLGDTMPARRLSELWLYW